MTFRSCVAVAASLCSLAALITFAQAASERVKSACKDDYFKHCSQHALGSQSLRQCMRSVGEDLSSVCLVALVEEGEVSKEDIQRYQAGQGKANKPANGQAAPEVKAKTDAVKPSSKPSIKPSNKPSSKKAVAKPKDKGKPPTKFEVAKPKSNTKLASTGKLGAKNASVERAKPVTSTGKVTKSGKPPAKVGLKPKSKTKLATSAPISSEPPKVFTHNLCQAQALNGTQLTMKCGLDQKCCFSPFLGQMSCVAQSDTCY